MRRRLTIAILALVAATLVATSVVSAVLIRHSAVSVTQRELVGQGSAISRTLTERTTLTKAAFHREIALIRKAGDFQSVQVVLLHTGGAVTGRLPDDLTVVDLDVPALLAGQQTSGHTTSLLVYTSVPTPLSGVNGYVPVVVITRQAHDPADGFTYFFVVGVIGLLVAALVAALLARRFTRPLVDAVAATRRIASGDLDATVDVRRREDPEFVQLAASINVMGATLARARDQERQFLLSVSHELRTPLTSIRGYADAVIDGATDDPAAAASVISSEARRLERLVQDLLDLARLDSDRFSLDLRPVDAAFVARQVVDGFRPHAQELGLDLQLAPGSEGPLWVQADADRLGQIVANLVENAASFARSRILVGVVGGPVATPAGPGAGPTIWVRDDGPGIPADHLDQVFQRHFSSDRARGRRQGSGLGLAIVAELAAAMGARVRVESPVGGEPGTRMLVALRPAVPPATSPTPPGGPSAAGPSSRDPHARSLPSRVPIELPPGAPVEPPDPRTAASPAAPPTPASPAS